MAETSDPPLDESLPPELAVSVCSPFASNASFSVTLLLVEDMSR
ncbi:MAG TPA: hypothetical protein VF057_05240 [Thermoanaerobaculia bacterium]